MEDKKENWEIQFENYQNGGLDKEAEELETKHDNKEIDIKKYMKEQKRLDKIKTNLPKVEHLVELREELKYLKNEIEKELVVRENESQQSKQAKQAKIQMEKLDKENEVLMPRIEDTKKQLKDKNLSDKDRQKLKNQLKKDEAKLNANNNKYLQLNTKSRNQAKTERTDDISKMSSKDLKENYKKVCMRLSRNNFYARRLLKGYDIEAVKAEDKNIDWEAKNYKIDMKKLIAKGKEAEKMKELREAAKEENLNQKTIEEELGKNVQKIMENMGETSKKVDEEVAMVEVSEFDQKHPRLAKIKNFLANIKNKILNKTNKENSELIEEKQEEKEEKEEIKEEPKEETKEEQANRNTTDKHKNFVSRLKDMDKYEIFDVAEKGMDGLEEERMSEAKKRLLENKRKSAEASKAKYEQGLNDYYKKHNINKTITDNTNYMDPSIKDEGR